MLHFQFLKKNVACIRVWLLERVNKMKIAMIESMTGNITSD